MAAYAGRDAGAVAGWFHASAPALSATHVSSPLPLFFAWMDTPIGIAGEFGA